MTYLKIAMGGAAIFSLLLIFATTRGDKPVGAKGSQFNSIVWDEAVLKKADKEKLPIVMSIDKSVVIDNEPAMVREDGYEPPDRPKKKTRKHTSRGDICTRHGMHKVETRHGKSWRCKK